LEVRQERTATKQTDGRTSGQGSPEWMVKLIDGDKHHLLCIQLKSGVENYSMEEVIDELAKCPEAEITGKVSLSFRDMK
jgi:hypothetical protein